MIRCLIRAKAWKLLLQLYERLLVRRELERCQLAPRVLTRRRSVTGDVAQTVATGGIRQLGSKLRPVQPQAAPTEGPDYSTGKRRVGLVQLAHGAHRPLLLVGLLVGLALLMMPSDSELRRQEYNSCK